MTHDAQRKAQIAQRMTHEAYGITMTTAPPEYLTLDRCPTPLGAMLLAVDQAGWLRTLDFTDEETRTVKHLRSQYGDSVDIRTGSAPAPIREALIGYFAGKLELLDSIPCAPSGTPFQQGVWTALRTIPAGRTLSYGGLAEQLGNPKAVRAVGLANGANPIPIVIPCHRVIGADGSLTGYGGGLARKRWLLAHEGRFSPLLA